MNIILDIIMLIIYVGSSFVIIEHHEKHWAGWSKLESRLQGEISITSDMQIIPPYGRKWRGTKKPLDGSERGEWKSWFKAQHSEN